MYDILINCPLFKGLGADMIENILKDRQYSVDKYSDGDLIAVRDTAYSGLMIVLKGRVNGIAPGKNGKKMTIDTISAPQLIAPAFLFGGYNRLPIDVEAEEDVGILILHRGLLFELMQENTIIMSNFIDIISDRANMLTKKIYFLSLKNIRDKMSRYILENTTPENPVFVLGDLNELSVYFNAPRNSITTVLTDMEKHGVISYSGNRIEVLKRERLG
ncbi:MAG: Crp/Fnr family transcriptional regulator [Rikenellaceae bacterium]|nr:Crp/Fnr family transcriptional regulator [Rikenellaceae bacterium]